ncbi:MAG: LysM peptidoglycan-binding domain-containing protein [Nevskiaceae bacterium]|jgi:membrane-bound lytic murein transglycosylase D|nr:MAG: LysM peptidoglycan-binding domain-containing protein [Nevskiaceae bacterium]TAM26456.1 MAG: LysM peptidoglycan-binding domain-containing protein [Nevskiaceae bacterium]
MPLNRKLTLAFLVVGSSAALADVTAPAPAPVIYEAPAPTAIPASAPMPASAAPAAPLPGTAPVALKAKAEPVDPLAHERELFPRPAALKGNIAFWRKVFAEYSENQSVIHDLRKPERVYAVLDFRDEAKTLGRVQLSNLKSAEEVRAKKRVEAALRRAVAQRDTPEVLDDEARKLAALFAGDRGGLREAADNVRSQRGLRERTGEAMAISGQYLPEMERTFANEGLPRMLTRLPFVESSFNVEAYSKVAAAGLWQFMPDSARMYMRFNHVSDDRRDPWTSTQAAAEHLRDDYRVLQDWPLAVTAYNYGRGGLARALKETGGNSLDDLLANYNNKRFGFASRNFYSEFLAAADVERDWREHFGDIQRRVPLSFETVTVERYTPYRTLVRLAGGDDAAFARLNPGYRAEVVNGKLYVPAGDRIRVPVGRASAFRAGYQQLASNETYGQQREIYLAYKVGKGDTLGGIAKRYGVSQQTLIAVNGLKKGRIRAGQTLKVPNDRDFATSTLVAKTESKPVVTKRHEIAMGSTGSKKAKLATKVHKVKSGQSLSVIAERYDTTVRHLLELNDLKDASRIRAGMKLKVPAA